MTKTIKSHRHDCKNHLLEALSDKRTTWRKKIGFSPYELVYGKNYMFPIEFQIMIVWTTLEANLDLTNAYKHCLD